MARIPRASQYGRRNGKIPAAGVAVLGQFVARQSVSVHGRVAVAGHVVGGEHWSGEHPVKGIGDGEGFFSVDRDDGVQNGLPGVGDAYGIRFGIVVAGRWSAGFGHVCAGGG